MIITISNLSPLCLCYCGITVLWIQSTYSCTYIKGDVPDFELHWHSESCSLNKLTRVSAYTFWKKQSKQETPSLVHFPKMRPFFGTLLLIQASLLASASPAPAGDAYCADASPTCPMSAPYCNDPQAAPSVRNMCQKTCHVCTWIKSTPMLSMCICA